MRLGAVEREAALAGDAIRDPHEAGSHEDSVQSSQGHRRPERAEHKLAFAAEVRNRLEGRIERLSGELATATFQEAQGRNRLELLERELTTPTGFLIESWPQPLKPGGKPRTSNASSRRWRSPAARWRAPLSA